jgi:hypothetical protein
MVESTRQVQSEDPYDRFEQAIADPRLYETTHQTYEFRYAETPEADLLHHDPVPLFLADNEDPRYHSAPEYAFGRSTRRKPRALRVVTCLLALSAAAILALHPSIRHAPSSSMPPAGQRRPFRSPPRKDAPRQRASPRSLRCRTVDAGRCRQPPIQPGALASASPPRRNRRGLSDRHQSMVVAVEPETARRNLRHGASDDELARC